VKEPSLFPIPEPEPVAPQLFSGPWARSRYVLPSMFQPPLAGYDRGRFPCPRCGKLLEMVAYQDSPDSAYIPCTCGMVRFSLTWTLNGLVLSPWKKVPDEQAAAPQPDSPEPDGYEVF
jgi:hypothetical protein